MSEPDIRMLPDTMLGPCEALYGTDLGPGAMVSSYVIEAVRSRGGFGTVYRAVGPSRELVAVKFLHASLVESESALRRFEQEVQVIQRIRHPNIVQIVGCGALTDGRPYVVMEWVEGRTLDEVLGAQGPFELAKALATADQLCAALSAVHAAGVVHRDIKGSNVMMLPEEGPLSRIKLLDFGIAKFLDQRTKLTRTGVPLGTPGYMAPEQIRGQRISPATDIYAMGILLFEMLTARLPFSAKSISEVEAMHLNAPPPRVSDFASVPDAMSDVIQRCLAKSPAQRYARVEALIEALRAARSAPEQQRSTFRTQEVQAASIAVAWAGEGQPSEVIDKCLAGARTECEAEGWMMVWEGERAFLVAMPLPSHEEAELRLRAAALLLALSLVRQRESGSRPLSVRVHAARASMLFVRGVPQIVGGDVLETADVPAGPLGSVLATEEALAGLEGVFELKPGPSGEPVRTVVRAREDGPSAIG
jgi:eukaryotic-like serine/threonine-protein kinase